MPEKERVVPCGAGIAAGDRKIMIDRKIPEKLGGYRCSDKINPGLRKSFPKQQYGRYCKNRMPHAKSRSDQQDFFKLFLMQIERLFF